MKQGNINIYQCALKLYPINTKRNNTTQKLKLYHLNICYDQSIPLMQFMQKPTTRHVAL